MWNSSSTFTFNGGDDKENKSASISDADIPSQLSFINEQRAKLIAQEGLLLEKGLQSHDPDILIKAQSHWNDIQQRVDSNFKSTIIDPMGLSDGLGYKHKATSLSFGLLRRMSRTPLIRSIIGTRQAQISAFARPQSDRFEPGFIIRKKKDYYSEEEVELTSADKAERKRLTEFLLLGGEKKHKWHGDNFEMFLKKIVEDSLTLDQATFEVIRNRIGLPVKYLATDGATMRVATTYDEEKYDGSQGVRKHGYLPSYVQLIDGEVKAEYYPWELCFGVRNMSTDIYRNGYGRSELEDLIEIVTYMLSADTYNGKFFTQGSNPKGIIKISGNINTNRLAEFRQQWQSMVAGVMNAHKVPVLESDKMEWIDLQKNNTDMQFEQWQEYLLKVACSVYKISPEEIGFATSGAGGGNAMFESGTEARLKYSRDKGLIPLLKQIEYWINHWLIEPMNEDFEFAFVGYDADSKANELELDVKLVQNFVGWKEMRRKWGYKEELEEGDFPLSNAWIQRMGQIEMAQMGADEEGDDEMDWDSLDTGIDEMDDVEKSIERDPLQSILFADKENPLTQELIKFWNDEIVNT